MRKLGRGEFLWVGMFLVGVVRLIGLPEKMLVFVFLIILIGLWFPITVSEGKKRVKIVK